MSESHYIACLALVVLAAGLVSSSALYAQEQDLEDGFVDDLNPFGCISDDYVPDFASDSDIVGSGRDSGILCQPVVEEEIVPAPEGLEIYDATGGTERRQAEAEVVDELLEQPLFDFESLLPAPRLPNNADEQETRTDFGFREPPSEPFDNDPSVVEASDEFDFDAQMAASRATAPSNSLSDPFREQSRPTQSGPVEIGDIYAAREQIALDNARQTFRAQNQQIQGQCECVYTSLSCFSQPSYDYAELNDSLTGADADFEFQKDKVCKDYNDWGNRIAVDQIDDIEQINALIGTTDTVLSNLGSLNNAHSNVLDDLRNAEIQIANQIRREEQARQEAIAAQNSGPSGWQIAGALAGAAGIASSGLPTDQAAQLGSSFIQDMLSDGSSSSMINTMQNYGYGSYDLDVPDYSTYSDAGYESGYGSAMDQVLVYGAPQAQNQADSYGQMADSTLSSGTGSSSPSGQYGAFMYSRTPNDFSIGMATSRASNDQALLDASAQCGDSCTMHEWFGPNQCAAVVFGRQSEAPGKYVFSETSSSRSTAENVALDQCEYRARGFSGSNTLTCSLAVSGCN